MLDQPITEDYTDVPIDVPQEETPDVPEMHQQYRTEAAFIDNYNTGRRLLDAYDLALTAEDPKTDLEQKSYEKSALDAQELKNTFGADVGADPESIYRNSLVVNQQVDQAGVKADDVHRQAAEAITGRDTATDAETAQIAFMFKAREVLAPMEKYANSAEGIFWDVASSFVPFKGIVDNMQATGSIWNVDDDLNNVIKGFRSLPVEDKEQIFPMLVGHFKDVMPEAKAYRFLKQLVNPQGEADYWDYSNVAQLLDAVGGVADAAGLAAAGSKAAKFGKSTEIVATAVAAGDASKTIKDLLNPVKLMSKSDAPNARKEAVDLNVASMMNADVAAEAGMNPLTAVNNSLPFVLKSDIAQTLGMSSDVIDRISEFKKKASGFVKDLDEGNVVTREGVVNAAYQAELEANALAKFRQAKIEEMQPAGTDLMTKTKGEVLDNSGDLQVEFSKVDDTATNATYTYKVKDPSGTLEQGTYTFDFKLDDSGYWEELPESVTRRFVASPLHLAKDSPGLKADAQAAIRADSQEAAVSKELHKLVVEAVAPVRSIKDPNHKALARVADVLLEGDQTGKDGKVFSVLELRGKGFSQPQIEVYYNLRTMYDTLFDIRNNAKRDEFVAKDFGSLDFNGQKLIGKDIEKSKIKGRTVLDPSTGKPVTVASLPDDAEIVKLASTLKHDGQYFNHILGKADQAVPKTVLVKRNAYVPREYENATYFVKRMVPRIVDGVSTESSSLTDRFFSSRKEADEFAAAQQQGTDSKYVVLEDNEVSKSLFSGDEVSPSAGGGLYTSARADDALLYGKEGKEAFRLNPLEALDNNISSVSQVYSRNLWRMGMQKRWLDYANKRRGMKGLAPLTEYGQLADDSTELNKSLNQWAKQIDDWSNFGTSQERLWDKTTQKAYEWAIDNKAPKQVQAFTRYLTNVNDPISTLLSVNFHALLGWFNPAQVFVQGQGATVGASIHGVDKWPKISAAATQFARKPDLTGDWATSAKIAGMTEQELKDVYVAYGKSGLDDSILTNADYEMALQGRGLVSEAISGAADSGLMFYRAGEHFNRRASFVAAYLELKDGVDLATNQGVKTLTTRANDFMLNMSKSNSAGFQKGAFRPASQFAQVATKTAELGLGNNFSTAQKAKIITTQIAMSGVRNTPLIGGTTGIAVYMGFDPEDNIVAEAINKGVWDTATGLIFGSDWNLGGRSSLLKGVADFTKQFMSWDTEFSEMVIGAARTSGNRFWTSASERWKIYQGLDNPTALDNAKLLAIPVLSILSSTNNLYKAQFMARTGTALSSSGDVLLNNVSLMDAIGQGIGFSPHALQETWTLSEKMSARSKYVNDSVSMLASNRAKAMAEDTPKAYEEFYALKDTINNTLTVDERIRVNSELDKKLSQAGSIADSVEYRHIRATNDILTEAAADDLDKFFINDSQESN